MLSISEFKSEISGVLKLLAKLLVFSQYLLTVLHISCGYVCNFCEKYFRRWTSMFSAQFTQCVKTNFEIFYRFYAKENKSCETIFKNICRYFHVLKFIGVRIRNKKLTDYLLLNIKQTFKMWFSRILYITIIYHHCFLRVGNWKFKLLSLLKLITKNYVIL